MALTRRRRGKSKGKKGKTKGGVGTKSMLATRRIAALKRIKKFMGGKKTRKH
jgi:hypothetical protein